MTAHTAPGPASSGRAAFEQPHDRGALLILVLVPARPVWGFDRRLVRRGLRRFGSWPF